MKDVHVEVLADRERRPVVVLPLQASYSGCTLVLDDSGANLDGVLTTIDRISIVVVEGGCGHGRSGIRILARIEAYDRAKISRFASVGINWTKRLTPHAKQAAQDQVSRDSRITDRRNHCRL